MPTAEVCRRHGLSTATFYKLKSKYGGMEVSEAVRLKALEDKNAKLKRLLADTIVDGSVGEITTQIEHRDDRGLDRFLMRHVDYAKWEARRMPTLKADPDAWARLTSRQQFKYRHMGKWWYPWFYFLGTYFGKRGFLDGAAGLEYAFYKAWYFQTIRLLLRSRPD